RRALETLPERLIGGEPFEVHQEEDLLESLLQLLTAANDRQVARAAPHPAPLDIGRAPQDVASELHGLEDQGGRRNVLARDVTLEPDGVANDLLAREAEGVANELLLSQRPGATRHQTASRSSTRSSSGSSSMVRWAM